MDTKFSCFFDDIKVFELDCGNDSPMLQMMRKDEVPYRVSSLIWTLRKTENQRKCDTTCCLTKNDSRGRLTP